VANVLRGLRDFVPIRPLTWVEAIQIAERQATHLLELTDVTGPAVPETIITKLPRMQVERIVPSPVAGASQWSRGRWLIVINGADPIGRQRFTLAHEFKHVLDNPFIKVLYPPLGGLTSHDRAEAICDYFAGALLVPRPWLKRAWREGIQDIPSLARLFNVSRQAMQVRLQQVGLVEPVRRHQLAA
jgi:Zn-dependent peptidase ImmA (M78 family)